MIASIIQSAFAASLKKEGKRRKNIDSNNTGSDDASGAAFMAMGEALDAVDLSTANKQTFKNMAAGFRAAADELDKAGE